MILAFKRPRQAGCGGTSFNPRALGTKAGGSPEFKDSLFKTLRLHRETLSGGWGGAETEGELKIIMNYKSQKGGRKRVRG